MRGKRRRERQLAAHSDSHHHEAELVVQAVGQHAAQVVLDHGVEDREHRHDHAQSDQDPRPGKPAGQGVDRQLGREGAEKDRARDRRFRVGVLKPVVQQRKGALDAEGQEDQ